MAWQLSNKAQHTIKTIATWAVVFIAYAYLIYTLLTTDWSAVRAVQAVRCWYLLPILLLMPLNILLEAAKWRYLLRDTYPMGLAEAQRQVYYGFVGAFITPYRAGDYPSRVLLMRDSSHWARAIALGVYGSVVLTAVILLAGLLPFCAEMMDTDTALTSMRPWLWLPALLAWPLCYLISRKNGSSARLPGVYLLSLARYIVFSLQLYLMLLLVGVHMSPAEALCRIPYYYLLVTVTPNIPISDPAIRGSWAVIAFGPMGAVAALLLWVVNTLLPMAIGGVIGAKEGTYRARPQSQPDSCADQ